MYFSQRKRDTSISTNFLSFSLFICFIIVGIPYVSFGQNLAKDEEINRKEFKSLTIQGGLYYDFGKEKFSAEEFDLSILSFNKIGVGGIKFSDNRAEQINLDFSWYNTTLPYQTNGVEIDGLESFRFSIDWEYFKSLTKHKEFRNKLHLGYVASVLIDVSENTSIVPNIFSNSRTSTQLGLGIKALYGIPFGEKNYFFFSTELNLIDVGVSQFTDNDPGIDPALRTQNTFGDVDIIRPRIGIDFGIML